MKSILKAIHERSSAGEKQFALLVDPDKHSASSLVKLIGKASEYKVDYFFIGGSLMTGGDLDKCVRLIKENADIPAILFPGSPLQISKYADAILFLSLISGRNPELLIGNHVVAAPYLRKTQLEVLPTGYMLVDCGSPTTASYISNSQPLPYNKSEIAACTALAGEYLGQQLIYLDGGSGAQKPVSESMIKEVAQTIDIPLIIGGGIRSAAEAEKAYLAGTDIIVVGNAIEQNPNLLPEIAAVSHMLKAKNS